MAFLLFVELVCRTCMRLLRGVCSTVRGHSYRSYCREPRFRLIVFI
jgi:hypothetical protein